MKGFKATAYVGAELHPKFKKPLNIDKIVESWCATRKEAEQEKRKLGNKYNAVVRIS